MQPRRWYKLQQGQETQRTVEPKKPGRDLHPWGLGCLSLSLPVSLPSGPSHPQADRGVFTPCLVFNPSVPLTQILLFFLIKNFFY